MLTWWEFVFMSRWIVGLFRYDFESTCSENHASDSATATTTMPLNICSDRYFKSCYIHMQCIHLHMYNVTYGWQTSWLAGWLSTHSMKWIINERNFQDNYNISICCLKVYCSLSLARFTLWLAFKSWYIPFSFTSLTSIFRFSFTYSCFCRISTQFYQAK